MGAAAIGVALFREAMRYNPRNPLWLNRDRFVLYVPLQLRSREKKIPETAFLTCLCVSQLCGSRLLAAVHQLDVGRLRGLDLGRGEALPLARLQDFEGGRPPRD